MRWKGSMVQSHWFPSISTGSSGKIQQQLSAQDSAVSSGRPDMLNGARYWPAGCQQAACIHSAKSLGQQFAGSVCRQFTVPRQMGHVQRSKGDWSAGRSDGACFTLAFSCTINTYFAAFSQRSAGSICKEFAVQSQMAYVEWSEGDWPAGCLDAACVNPAEVLCG